MARLFKQERLKLFSEKPRRMLFSSEDSSQVLRTVICKDCGHTVTTSETVTHMICPNCGGKRFDLALFKEEEKKVQQERRYSLFENFLTPYEKNLKEFSGKTMERDEFEKVFSSNASDMIDKRFADVMDSGCVEINPLAFEMERTFSKLIISVTKTLELDPQIMKGEVEKEEVIDRLEDKMPEKSILVLKKAHDIPTVHAYSEEEEDTWLQDSCIVQDLELEYNNESFPIEQFIKILRERYPDAPENIMEILSEVGAIRIEGAKVTVQSNSKK